MVWPSLNESGPLVKSSYSSLAWSILVWPWAGVYKITY